MRQVVVLAAVIFSVLQVQARLEHLNPGKEYHYDYWGHVLATVENNGNRQTGLGIKSKVTIKVSAPGTYTLQLQNVRTAEVDDDLDEVDEDTIPFNFQSASQSNLAAHLERPVRVHTRGGTVQSLETSQDEPHESVNIKKAIITLLQLNNERIASPGSSSSSSSSSFSSSSSSSQRSARSSPQSKNNQLNGNSNDDSADVFVVVEDGVGGECETRYVVNSDPSPANPNADVLNVTKVRNYRKCSKRPRWVRSTQVPNECANCEADEQHPFGTVAIINYDIQRRGQELVVEKIESEARTIFAPYSHNSDYFSANHSQSLTLRSISQSSSSAQSPANPKTHSTLQYKFPTAKRALEQGSQSLKRPLVAFLNDQQPGALSKAKQLLEEISQEVAEEATNFRYNENTPYKLYKLVKTIRKLNYDEAMQMYNEACSQRQVSASKDKKQLCINALTMAGSNPTTLLLKYLIESQAITGEQAVQAAQGMATNMFEPSYEIVNEILNLAKSRVAREHSQLFKTSWLTFAIAVSKACDGPDDDIPTVPTAPHKRDYCPQEVERKYLQELNQGLQNARTKGETLMFLKALGLTELPGAVEYIQPYASADEDEADDDESIQIAALQALKPIGKFSPDEVQDVAEDEFYDTDNTPAVRIAALRAILSSQPDTSDLQTLVAWADKEPSDDVAGYINSFFDSMANSSHYCNQELASDAQELLDQLDDEDDNGIQGSNFFEWSQAFDEMGMSTQAYVSYTASNSSIFPETIHAGINTTIGGYSYQPLQMTIQTKGAQTLLDRTLGPKGAFSNLRSLEDIFKPESEDQDKQRTSINNKLNLETREEDPFFVNAFFKVAGTQARMFYADHQSIANFIKSGMQSASASLADLPNGIPIHYHKASLLHEIQMQVPSPLGVPLFFNVFNPTIASVKGKISARIDASSSSSGRSSGQSSQSPLPGAIQVEAELKPSYSSRLGMRLGVYNPFNKMVSVVGVATSTYASVPVTINAQANLLNGEVSVNLKPTSSQFKPNAENPKLFHYKVKPYSCQYSIAGGNSNSGCQNPKTIHTDSEPEKNEIDLNREVLGVPVIIKSKSEGDWNDFGAFLSDYYDYEDFASFVGTAWTTPDFSPREYNVELDSRNAQDKEIDVSADVHYSPTPAEKLVLQSKRRLTGFWTVLSGFAELPQKCGNKNRPDFSSSDSDAWYMNSQALNKNARNRYNQNDDDDDDDDDDNQGSSPSSSSSQKWQSSSSSMKSSPWSWKQHKSSNDDTQSYSKDSPYQSSSSSNQDNDDDDQSQQQGGMPYSQQLRNRGSATIEKIHRQNEVSSLKINFRASAKGSSSAKLMSSFTYKRDRDALTDVASVTVDMINVPALSSNKLQVCATSTIKYPQIPCDFHSQMSPAAGQPIYADAQISWGQQCSSGQQVVIKAKFEKSKEQERMEREKSEWYFQQCQEDIQEGKKLSSACDEAQDEFSSLNKMTVTAEFNPQNMPPSIKNLTRHIDTFLKAKYYKQMSNNPVDVDNGAGRFKAVLVFHDEVPALDLKLFKPRENTFFTKIDYTEDMPMLNPINTQNTILEEITDDLTDGMASPSCEVMGKYVNTFDNNTHKIPLSNCYHVVAKDCSPDDLFAVTMANAGNNLKNLKVYVLQHKISVKPQGRYSGQFQVEVEGELVKPSDNEVIVVKSNDPDAHGKVVALIVTTGPSIHIKLPNHGVQVEFDGEDASVEVSQFWRGKVCGLCGEFREDTDDDLVGPRQCIYPDPVSFGISYGLQDQQCQLPSPPNPNKLCDEENSSNSGSRRNKQRSNNDDSDDNDDENYDNSNNNRNQNSRCEAQRNQITYKSNKICFSLNPVKECQSGCQEADSAQKNLGFHCLPEGDPKAEQLKKARDHRPLNELANKRADIYEDVSVPRSCTPQ